ncbi:hypothetical protein [Candidatus Bandiella euplotis]|uniref:Uncharacterized protein n=1 Tax=Candidatus Bandiella euplotis TaxID=1664265 RepID=A0ABZ0UP83_9RICK|nr:hypothetical protein [Candidatus Bandiella woodruffii]WPX96809.1 hypothetical protein Bandiella_00937 [Candidatus Bandiella woodruffii]
MSQVGMAKDSYLKILKEIANTQDDSKIAINIDVDLKNIENHSRHKIGKVRFSDLKNKLKQRTMPSGLANQNGR